MSASAHSPADRKFLFLTPILPQLCILSATPDYFCTRNTIRLVQRHKKRCIMPKNHTCSLPKIVLILRALRARSCLRAKHVVSDINFDFQGNGDWGCYMSQTLYQLIINVLVLDKEQHGENSFEIDLVCKKLWQCAQ